MGMLDKFLNAMKLNSDNEDDFYDEEEYFDEEEEFDDPAPRRSSVRKEKPAKVAPEIKPAKRESSFEPKPSKPAPAKVTPMRAYNKRGNAVNMEVCVVKPHSFDDARDIADTLIDNRTLILNLEGCDYDLAQRIIDFSCGACYAIDGNLRQIARYIFVVTPGTVDISGDFLETMMGGFEGFSLPNDI